MTKKNLLTAVIVSAVVLSGLFWLKVVVEADNAYHALSPGTPLIQDWSNMALLDVADDWSGVPSINGYSDNVTDNPGGDPQLQLIPSVTIDSNPNRNSANLFGTGGVAEFDRGDFTNFVVGLQGSNGADYPNIDIRLNTSACSSPANVVNISYNLRDIDGSADNAVQQIALHYRVGTSGNYTNVPGGYVADATTGPNLATLVTPISLNLPAATQGQSQVHLRVMTSNAAGNDEWVGIDDLNISCQPADTTPPTIAYTTLSNTTNTTNRILTATIADAVGVASGALLPRIYFRKNAGSYFSTQCALTSGNAQSGTYDCTIDNSLIGGVAAGDSVGYYVIAQDTSGNIASNPAGAIATNVNTVTTPPTPNSYSILQNFNGAFSVGTGEAITSLTNNGGLFQQMNAGTISGNVTVNLTSDLTAETGTHSLNQLTETGGGGYTIIFQSSGAARVISGNSATALINLNGADRVTFSGLAFGPQGLTIRNTSSSGATVRMVNDASNNSILSCVIEGENVTVGSGVVVIGTGPTTGNDGNSISDSIVRDRTDAAGIPLNLIYLDSSGGSTNSGTVIANNQLINFTQTGMFNGVAENSTISGNTISQTGSRTTQVFAIQLVGSTGTNTISQNVIRDHSTTSSFVGINLQSIGGTTTVSRNRIYNIDNSSGSVNPFNGVQLTGNDAGTTVGLENNMISVSPSTLTPHAIQGILDARTAGTLNVQHNSIYLGESSGTRGVNNIEKNSATSAGVTQTWAFRRTAGSTATVSLTNNIFFNNRPPGTDNYAVGDQSAGAGVWSSNHNLYVGRGSTAANFFDLNGVAVDFATWQAGPPARDANAISGVAGSGPFNVNNMFASPNDLHLSIAGNNPAINNAAPGGAAVDFDGQPRPFGATPDIGADEVQTAPTAADASIGGRVVTVNGRGIRNIRVTVTGGALTEPRVAITNAFGYFVVDGLRAGETYLVSVGGKRFVFETPARVISLGEDALDVNFIGLPR